MTRILSTGAAALALAITAGAASAQTPATNQDRLGAVVGALKRFYGDETPAPNTVVGVQSLALPDFLVEIEAIAQFRD